MKSKYFLSLFCLLNSFSLVVLTLTYLCSSVIFPSTVWSQVNVEQNRRKVKSGFSGSADAALTLIRGNVSLTQTNVGAKLDYAQGIHSPFVQVALDYGEKESMPFLSQSYGHARWTAMWSSTLGTEVFAQLQANTFRSLVLRQLYGGGVRSELWSTDKHSLAIGVGGMYEREFYRESTLPNLSEGGVLDIAQEIDMVENNIRLTNYLSTKHTLKWEADLTLLGTMYYQPRAERLSDYRILFDLSIEIKLSNHLRLVESLGVMYDSAPPEDVQRSDLKSLSALRLSF